MSVLLVTRSDDHLGVEYVADEIRARGHEAIRLDTDRYPLDVRLSTTLLGDHTARVLSTPLGRFDLNDVTAVWHRRFFAGGSLPADLGDLLGPAVDESRRSLYGMIAALPARQVDRLEDVRRCDHKERQLLRARALGLDVPRTLFSNDPDAVRAFFATCNGRVVTKMQSSFAVWRGGNEHVVFTSALAAEDVEDLDGLRYCPMIFQEIVDKHVELRATVVGDRVFCAAVDSQRSPAARVDWRKDGAALLRSWTPYSLPTSVREALLAVVRDIGLRYAACDLIVTPDGRHVFLEANAGGEWFWLDEHVPGSAALPIAAAIAEELCS